MNGNKQIAVADIYARAAKMAHQVGVSVERCAEEIERYTGIPREEAAAGIQALYEELREPTVTGRAEVRAEPVVAEAVVAGDFDKAREGGAGQAMVEDKSSADLLNVISHIDAVALDRGDVLNSGTGIAEQLSFVGLPARGTVFDDFEVDLVMDAPLEKRIRFAVAGQAEPQHRFLMVDDVVLVAYSRREMSVSKWNDWTATRRARVYEAELQVLREAAARNAKRAQSGVTSVLTGASGAGDAVTGAVAGALPDDGGRSANPGTQDD